MKDQSKNRWENAWTHSEDGRLIEAMEYVGSTRRACYAYLKTLGVNRSYRAMVSRIQLLKRKNQQLKREYNVPKGWGFV